MLQVSERYSRARTIYLIIATWTRHTAPDEWTEWMVRSHRTYTRNVTERIFDIFNRRLLRMLWANEVKKEKKHAKKYLRWRKSYAFCADGSMRMYEIKSQTRISPRRMHSISFRIEQLRMTKTTSTADVIGDSMCECVHVILWCDAIAPLPLLTVTVSSLAWLAPRMHA